MPRSPSVPAAFADNAAHIAAELAWLELVLRREVVRARDQRSPAAGRDEFAGMYVSDAEIDAYIGEPTADVEPARREIVVEPDPVAARRTTLDEQLGASRALGVPLRLPALATAFGLDGAETGILLAALAPDVAARFERYYAYLQNDVTRRRPTVQLLARLCLGEAASVLHSRRYFGHPARLWRHRLVEWPAPLEARAGAVFPAEQVTVTPNVVAYLLGLDRVDGQVDGVAQLQDGRPLHGAADYFRRHAQVVADLRDALDTPRPLPCYLWGPARSGKSAVVSAVSHANGRRVLQVSVQAALGLGARLPDALERIARDARLHACAIHLRDADALLDDPEPPERAAVPWIQFLRAPEVPVLLTGAARLGDLQRVLDVPLHGAELPLPDPGERQDLWRRALDARCADAAALEGVAARFRFTPGQIDDVVRGLAAGSASPRAPVSTEELFRACRAASNQRLLAYARKVAPRARWDDIVLTGDHRAQLEEICAAVRHRRTVYEAWGFDRHSTASRGLSVLFSGPSGTGKTLSAEIVAGELGLDLYQVDLSCVVSKYVGETERNLSRIFREAETSNSILFFDEADALFGRRSEVKDAHDRYANIEIGFLLQQLDAHDGTVILATNLKNNLDGAFARRLQHMVEFSLPDAGLRERIWRKVFPETTPLAADVDLGFVARRFKLSGGNIRNIALNAAFLAAQDGGCVTMTHIIRGTKREYQKAGRLCSRSDFGQYFGLVQDESAA